jgi:WD40 repeat protein
VNPVDLLTTTEEISRPFAANTAEVAFALGGPRWDTIGVASLTTGRITRRIPAGKGLLTSVAFSPIGELIYFSAGGYIWSVDRGGRIERVAVGDSIAAGRDFLAVRSRENGTQHLYRVPMNGGTSIEVQHEEPLHNLNISPNSVTPDGRILSSVAPVDSWFFPPAMTGKSGQLERISIDYQGDIHSMAWTPDGKVIALTQVVRARVWKFTPQSR